MKVGIYGAGQYGETLYKILVHKSVKVDFFIDQYKQQKELNGIPIYRLDNAPKDTKIFLSLPSLSSFPSEIRLFLIKIFPPTKDELKSLGFKEVYSFEDVIELYPEFLERLISFNMHRFKPIPDQIFLRLKQLFSDELSLETLESIHKFRKNPSYQNYPYPSKETQYFPPFVRDYFKNTKIRFVDMGAFKGDTLAWLFHIFKDHVESVVVFEPIADFISDIQEVLNFFENKYSFSANIIPAGVWSENTVLKFQKAGASSSVSKEGELIPAFEPDSILLFAKPNFVKMDIEGSELNALMGMEKTIRKYKPLMAISVYHTPEDLWRIPFWIKENFPFYNLKLRLHGHVLTEIVLYCIP